MNNNNINKLKKQVEHFLEIGEVGKGMVEDKHKLAYAKSIEKIRILPSKMEKTEDCGKILRYCDNLQGHTEYCLQAAPIEELKICSTNINILLNKIKGEIYEKCNEGYNK